MTRGAVAGHLAEAAALAERTGERNTALQHFGPTNVALWRVVLAVDLGEGPAAAEAAEADPSRWRCWVAGSAPRTCPSTSLAGGRRLTGTVMSGRYGHWTLPIKAAPTLVRNHPLARELLADLYGRARRQVWELDSLRHRFGIWAASPHVNN